MLITERNINVFLESISLLPRDRIAGFLRYEVDSYGGLHSPYAHSHFSWLPGSAEQHGWRTFAQFTSEHSAPYMLTRGQLRGAIASGGFPAAPHRGAYDYECSASTDVYTRCGLTRVICVSDPERVLIWHTPNVYIGRMDVGFGELSRQMSSLEREVHGRSSTERLFETR